MDRPTVTCKLFEHWKKILNITLPYSGDVSINSQDITSLECNDFKNSDELLQ